MRKIILLGIFVFILTLLAIETKAQNAITGSGFTNGWSSGCGNNGNFTYFSASVGTTYTSGDLTPKGTGNQYWRMATEWGGTIKEMNNNGIDQLVSAGAKYSLNTSCTTSGAMYVNVSSTNNRYIFKTLDAGSTPTGTWVFFALSGTSVFVSTVAQSPVAASVCAGQAVTVTATLNSSFPTGQGAYLRYSTDNFSTSTTVAMTGSGTSYSASIPSGTNTSSTTVKYYIFTSGSGLTIAAADADLYTINLNNNSGSNYSYTVNSTTSISSQSTTTQTVYLGGTSGNFSPITVSALGSGLAYQWYSNASSSNSGGASLGSNNGAQTYSYTPQATSVGTLYYYCIVTGTCSTATSTVSGAFIVNALNNPTPTTPFSVTTSTVALAWAKDGQSHNVMIVRNTSDSWIAPTNGSPYTAGNTIGSGTVVYNGDLTNYSNAGLSASTAYYYKFYSENYSYYSSGATTASATTSSASSSATDYFRSKAAGSANWGVAGTWESSADGSTNWITSTLVPDGSATLITVQNTHTVTLAATAVAKAITIASGGTLDCGSYTLNIATGGSFTNSGAFTAGTGTVAFAGSGTVSGTIGFNNVTLAGGVNFGPSSTVNGMLTINSSGYVNTNAPVYASGSTLKYNTTGSYGRGTEWSATSNAGYPYHVQISNNTTVDMGANSGNGTERQCAGNLTVDVGSTFTLNATAMTAAVTVMGNVVNNGTITLSGSSGGDLKSQGNINDSGTFNANSRAVFFNGSGTQVIQGTGTFDISYVRINKSGGSVQLATNLTCAGPGGGNAMEIEGINSMLDLNGYTLILGETNVASTYNSGIGTPGKIKGGGNSSISILGLGALGTLNFDQTTPGTTNLLKDLTINRTSSGSAVIGTDLAISNSLLLTAGTVTSGASTKLTLLEGSKATTESGTSLTMVDLVFSKGTTTTSQFENKGTIDVTGKIRVKVHFPDANRWQFVSFPFDITSISRVDAGGLTYDTNYGMIWYDTQKRADRTLPAWTHQQLTPVAGTGYAFWSTGDLYFDTQINPDLTAFATTITKALDYKTKSGGGGLTVNAGWNFLAHPVTTNAYGKLNLGEFHYAYNYGADTYTATEEINLTNQQSFDAYFIKTTVGRTMNFSTVSMPSSVRSLVSNSIDNLTLNLMGNTANYSTLVRVLPQSTVAYDELYDAPYSPSMLPTTPQIYSFIAGEKFAINSVPEQSSVPIGIRVPTTGSFTFTWDAQLTNLPVILYDNVADKSTDMSVVTSYYFDTQVSGEINNRFFINVAQKTTTGFENMSNEATIHVYSQSRSIKVEGISEKCTVRLFDMVGKLYNVQKVSNNALKIAVPAVGVYLLEVENNSQVWRKKVIVH